VAVTSRDSATVDFGPLPTNRLTGDDPQHFATSSPAEETSLPSERLLGTLVHRLVQRYGLHDGKADSMTPRSAWDLLRPEERAALEDPESLVRRALEFVRHLSTRGDVRALYDSSRASHEVPFTFRKGNAWVRGSIDCIVTAPPAAPDEGRETISILEFKTGRPRPEHRVQAALYREAVESMFPGKTAEAALVYRDHLERL
jgi:ATP-dependent exoDNAse (exonuclease V) beta subunit